MYLLHGGGGDEDGWIIRGRANYIIDNLIASKEAVPMIVVITNGNPDSCGAAGPTSAQIERCSRYCRYGFQRFEESLVKDVVPYIEKNYRVFADADHRAITGFSMGGYQTQNITTTIRACSTISVS